MAPGPDILDSLNTAICLLDRKLAVTYLNPAAETLFETSLSQSAGKHIAEILPNVPDIHIRLDEGLAKGEGWTEREAQLVLPHQHHITADLTVTPLGRPPHCQALILELSPADRRLQISHEEEMLIQNQTTQALTRGLAHEIKNPLGGIRGAAQLLERELNNPELREYTQIIVLESDRLKTLVDTMLGPNSRPQPVALNLHEPLEHVRALVQSGIGDNIHIATDYDPSLPDILIDRGQIIQALLNLLQNACQALTHQETTKKGLITIRTRSQRRVTIGHHCHRLVARIDIQDDGPGIPDAIRAHIFLPMVTGRAEGTGLGLPLAQTLIQKNGGVIECHEADHQTTFSILLPLEN